MDGMNRKIYFRLNGIQLERFLLVHVIQIFIEKFVKFIDTSFTQKSFSPLFLIPWAHKQADPTQSLIKSKSFIFDTTFQLHVFFIFICDIHVIKFACQQTGIAVYYFPEWKFLIWTRFDVT